MIVLIEQVSIRPEIKALKRVTAEEIMQAFLEFVVTRFGAERELVLVSDNASTYASKLMEIFCKTFTVTCIFTTAYTL